MENVSVIGLGTWVYYCVSEHIYGVLVSDVDANIGIRWAMDLPQ